MSDHAAFPGHDWQSRRIEIRALCRDMADAITEDRGLGDLRPRPLQSEIESAREGLLATLQTHDWSSRKECGIAVYKPVHIVFLFYGICEKGHGIAAALHAVVELIESGAATPFVPPIKNPEVVDLDAGEGLALLKLSPDTINRYQKWWVLPDKPEWDSKARTLTFKGRIIKAYKRDADMQFKVLDQFEAEGWPPAITVSANMSRQTTQSINSSMNPESPIAFGFSEKAKRVSWKTTS